MHVRVIYSNSSLLYSRKSGSVYLVWRFSENGIGFLCLVAESGLDTVLNDRDHKTDVLIETEKKTSTSMLTNGRKTLSAPWWLKDECKTL